ncbi:hypothetical protein NFI00_000221 [Salmonella enterica]|nr:hypothetical protein [Salmonella enterica subsp. enterica serovar Minnesota]EJI5696518.1 hypothetical protein [Salmonella enterica]
MSEIKIEQKLSKQQSVDMQAQYKNGVVYILSKLPEDNKCGADLIVGKAKRIMFLHSKLVVHAELLNNAGIDPKGKFKVSKLVDGFAIHPL